jgi:hypothetical protein
MTTDARRGIHATFTNFFNEPRNLQFKQELYVSAPGRGVVLYQVNAVTVTSTSPSDIRINYSVWPCYESSTLTAKGCRASFSPRWLNGEQLKL